MSTSSTKCQEWENDGRHGQHYFEGCMPVLEAVIYSRIANDDASNGGDEATTLDEPQPNPLDLASEAGPRRGSRDKRKTVKFSLGGARLITTFCFLAFGVKHYGTMIVSSLSLTLRSSYLGNPLACLLLLEVKKLAGRFDCEGYVAEEALTFSSYYFWDVTIKFNCLDSNVDFPPLSQFPMKEEFPSWLQIRQRHVDKDPGVSASSELFALAYGPTPTPISVNSCIVNCVRGVIVVEDNTDIIHVDNSSDLALTTSLDDLKIMALHIDGQSIDVDAPPYIINVDENDDIIDDEDVLHHDLQHSDDEDLVIVNDDDGVAVVYSSEEED
nr:hypothetical protein [Tanacetum cinerariifolium]